MFKLGENVTWRSQAGGKTTTKIGKVMWTIPSYFRIGNLYGDLSKLGGMNIITRGSPNRSRRSRSYVVKVGGLLYWPRTNYLASLDAPVIEKPAEPVRI